MKGRIRFSLSVAEAHALGKILDEAIPHEVVMKTILPNDRERAKAYHAATKIYSSISKFHNRVVHL